MPVVPATDQMLESLIGSPSVSSTHPHLDTSNLPVINLLANWLDEVGFEVKIQTVTDNKANLIARIGDGDDGLVLSGHTDTVPYDDSLWQSDPFTCTRKDNRLYGLGTSDMKSFFALAITALEHINLNKLTRPLTILATADEESTMAGAKALLEDRNKLGQFCVIGEPTNLNPVRQHKGIFMESVKLTGQSGHSSDPDLGNSALEGMQEIIQAILNYRDRLGKQFVDHDFAVPLPTLNLGHIHGGDNANRICGSCELHYDLRLLPDMELNQIRNALREVIQDIARRRGLVCEFTSLFDGTPALSTPANSEIVKMTEALTHSISQSVVFATEGPYFSQLGMETVILGPGSIEVAHQPNEFIEIEQLQQAIDTYRALINEVCISR